MVEELAGLGAMVYTCSRKEADLNDRLKEWEALGLRVTGSVCDLASREQRVELMQKVSSVFDGKLNILVSSLLGVIYVSVNWKPFEKYCYGLLCIF